MIEKITDHNLERYDSRLKEWCDKKFFEKGSYGKYEITEESSAVAFYPAPNTPLEGKVKFSFKETMPAEGVKGPDNPSTITGVSQIDVFRTSVSLIPKTVSPSYYNVNADLSLTVNQDGSVTINGDAVNNAYSYIWGNPNDKSQKAIEILLPKNISISLLYEYISGTADVIDENNPPSESNPVAMQTLIGDGDSSSANRITTSLPGTISTRQYESQKYFKIRIASWKGYRFSNYTVRPYAWFSSLSLNDGKENQNEKFTVSLNNTYYGGFINLATGMMTITHKGMQAIIGSSSVYAVKNGLAICILNCNEAVKNDNAALACTRFPVVNNDTQEGIRCRGSDVFYSIFCQINMSRLDFSSAVDPSNPTFAEIHNAFAVWLAANPMDIVFRPVNTSTIQLDPIQISALAQQDKYTSKLNTVYADADSVQISYLKSPIRDEYEKTQAILSLGGNS